MFIEYFKKIAYFMVFLFTFRTKREKTPQLTPVLQLSDSPAPTQAPIAQKKRVGRPRKFSNNAERQKAYRHRKRQAKVIEFRRFIDASHVDAIEQFIQDQETKTNAQPPV